MIGLSAISRGLAAGVIATACLAATGADAATKITIVNNLDQALTKGSSTKSGGVKFAKTPPKTIPAHSSATFHVEKKSGSKRRFEFSYTVAGGQLRLYYDGKPMLGCFSGYFIHQSNAMVLSRNGGPTVTVQNCGDFKSKEWTYTINPRK